MAQQPGPDWPRTLAEFHRWHAEQPDVFEFIDGAPRLMAPGSKAHTLIKSNTHVALAIALRDKPCRAYVDGASIETAASFLIPDVVVECSPTDFSTPSVAEPILIVEVASPGSEKDDLGTKERIYLALPSLQHYLIVHQSARAVVHHERRDDLGGFLTAIVRDGSIRLDPPGIALALDDVYAGVELAGEGSA